MTTVRYDENCMFIAHTLNHFDTVHKYDRQKCNSNRSSYDVHQKISKIASYININAEISA